MENFKVDKLILKCIAGSEIGKSVAEAVKIAMTENKDVYFKHNGKEYLISPFKIVAAILEDKIK